MRFVMFMIPEVYQQGKKVDPNHTPSAEAVAAMMKYNEDLAKSGVFAALTAFIQLRKVRASRFLTASPV